MLLASWKASATLAGVFAAALAPAVALADPGDACVTSYEGGQKAKKEGAFVRSKAELRLCVGSCPGVLSADCEKWLREVEAQIGRATVRAFGPGREPLPSATVFIDGLAREQGAAVELDPGPHELRVEAQGHAPARRAFRLAPGAGVEEIVELERVPAGSSEPPGAPDSLPVGPIALGSASLAALAAGGVLGLVGYLDVSNMRDERTGCAPACPEARVVRVRDLWIAGGVVGGAGALGLVGAVVWYAVGMTADPAPRAGVVLTPIPGGGAATVVGAF